MMYLLYLLVTLAVFFSLSVSLPEHHNTVFVNCKFWGHSRHVTCIFLAKWTHPVRLPILCFDLRVVVSCSNDSIVNK